MEGDRRYAMNSLRLLDPLFRCSVPDNSDPTTMT